MPSAQRGAKSAGQRRSKVYSTSRLSAERVSGVADAAGRADARVERGGDPGLPGRLLSRHLERHLARGHAARGQAVEQPRPRRLGEGERLPTHTCDGAPDDSSAMYPTTKTPYAGQPKRPAAARSTVSSAGAKNGGRIANCSSRHPSSIGIPRRGGRRGPAPPQPCALARWRPPRPAASRTRRSPRTPLGVAPVHPQTAPVRGPRRRHRRQNDAQHRPLPRHCCWRGPRREMLLLLIGKGAMRAGTCRGASRGRR